MKVDTPEIAWHYDMDSTTSQDFHPFTNQLAVANSDSSGAEIFLRVWYIDIIYLQKNKINNKGDEEIMKKIFRLQCQVEGGHTLAINCVRFSPNGKYIATGGDDAKIIIWQQKYRPKEFGCMEMVPSWAEFKPLLGHGKEVYDIRWSSCGQWLFSASLDNSMIVWSVEKGKNCILLVLILQIFVFQDF